MDGCVAHAINPEMVPFLMSGMTQVSLCSLTCVSQVVISRGFGVQFPCWPHHSLGGLRHCDKLLFSLMGPVVPAAGITNWLSPPGADAHFFIWICGGSAASFMTMQNLFVGFKASII